MMSVQLFLFSCEVLMFFLRLVNEFASACGLNREPSE